MSDDITGIFDHLSPDDFLGNPADAQRLDMPPSYTFDDFVADQCNKVKFAYAAADGDINTMTILATDASVVIFQANDDESLSEYVERMNAEARRMKAKWAFFYRKTMVTKAGTTEPVRADQSDLVNIAIENGNAWEAMYWYASRRDGDEPLVRHGYIVIDGDKLGAVIEAPTQANDLLGRILN